MEKKPLNPHVEVVHKLAYSIPEAVAATGLGRSLIYDDIATGALKARKRGSRTIIMVDELRRYLTALPEMEASRC